MISFPVIIIHVENLNGGGYNLLKRRVYQELAMSVVGRSLAVLSYGT